MRAKLASGLQRNPPGSGLAGAHFARGKNRACENRRGRERSVLPENDLSGLVRHADPPFPGGFSRYGFWVVASRKRDARTGHSAHSASLPHNRQPINQLGYGLVRKGILHLDAIAGSMAFSES